LGARGWGRGWRMEPTADHRKWKGDWGIRDCFHNANSGELRFLVWAAVVRQRCKSLWLLQLCDRANDILTLV